MSDPTTNQTTDWQEAREAAWECYQGTLGNLTTREENIIERAFKAGWLACDHERIGYELGQSLKAAGLTNG